MNKNKKYTIAAIALVLIAVVTFLCFKFLTKKDSVPPIVEKTLDGKSPEEYYKDLAEQEDCQNLDSIYIVTIMELCDSCNYEDMLSLLPQLQYTPAYESAIGKYIVKRDMIIDSIEYSLSTFIDATKTQFVEDIIPILLQEVNDDLVEQLQKALEQYEDEGFAGMVRDTNATLGFRLKDSTDLDNAWDKFIGNRYTKMLNGFIQDYSVNIDNHIKEYDRTSNYKPKGFNIDDFTLVKPSAVMSKYSEEQNKQMIKDFAIDGGMLVLSFVTSGTAAVVIEVVDFAYSSYQIYNQFNEEEQSETDKLIVSVAEFVDIQIESYLRRKFYTYLEEECKTVFETVLNQMEQNEFSLNLREEDNISPIANLKNILLDELLQTK